MPRHIDNGCGSRHSRVKETTTPCKPLVTRAGEEDKVNVSLGTWKYDRPARREHSMY